MSPSQVGIDGHLTFRNTSPVANVGPTSRIEENQQRSQVISALADMP